jgi:hypothetical protein
MPDAGDLLGNPRRGPNASRCRPWRRGDEDLVGDGAASHAQREADDALDRLASWRSCSTTPVIADARGAVRGQVMALDVH